MKANINTLAPLVLFVLVLLGPQSKAVRAQESKEEKRLKPLAEKVVETFNQSLEETMDFSRVDRNLFDLGFEKRNEALSDDIDEDILEIFEQVAPSEIKEWLFEDNTIRYLQFVAMSRFDFDERNSLSDRNFEERKRYFRKVFGDTTVELIETSKVLTLYGDSYWEPESVEELRAELQSLVTINTTLRKKIQSDYATWRLTSKKNLTKWREEHQHFEVIKCKSKDECLGYPEGTRFVYILSCPFQIRMVEVDGSLKIVQISDHSTV